MPDSNAQSRAPARISGALVRGLRESGAIVLTVVAGVICVALLSFDAHDPGYSVAFSGAAAGVHNRIGPVGAWFANVLYFLFGRPAYLLPVMLAFAAWRLLRARSAPAPRSRLNAVLRTAGFLALLIASCALAALHWDGEGLPAGAGGIVGRFPAASGRHGGAQPRPKARSRSHWLR